jgi:hypothetical protein
LVPVGCDVVSDAAVVAVAAVAVVAVAEIGRCFSWREVSCWVPDFGLQSIVNVFKLFSRVTSFFVQICDVLVNCVKVFATCHTQKYLTSMRITTLSYLS